MNAFAELSKSTARKLPQNALSVNGKPIAASNQRAHFSSP